MGGPPFRRVTAYFNQAPSGGTEEQGVVEDRYEAYRSGEEPDNSQYTGDSDPLFGYQSDEELPAELSSTKKKTAQDIDAVTVYYSSGQALRDSVLENSLGDYVSSPTAGYGYATTSQYTESELKFISEIRLAHCQL